jgi:hypothetical protein
MRFRPLGLLLSGLVASSACSDATAPSSPLAPSDRAARALGPQSGEWSDWQGRGRAGAGSGVTSAGVTSYVVRIDPRRGNVVRFGDYTLEVPANAICDRSSGYGLELFDLTCKAERGAVTITAVVRTTTGGLPRIDLMPEMRFNPGRAVTLTLSVPNFQASAASPRILYCATPATKVCVDEAQFDPTLTTHVDPAAGTVFRRIKHFSGYFVEW